MSGWMVAVIVEWSILGIWWAILVTRERRLLRVARHLLYVPPVGTSMPTMLGDGEMIVRWRSERRPGS